MAVCLIRVCQFHKFEKESKEMEEETVCKNWFMRKSGKSWIFGCAVFFVLGLATALPVAAEEISQTTAADTAVTEVRTEDSSQTSSQETAVTETTQF